MDEDDVIAACNSVDLDGLPGLPGSLLAMVMEGRRGLANPALRGQWSDDLVAYAAGQRLTAVVTPKFTWLRVMFFKAPDLKEHALPSTAMESLARALEVCSFQQLH